MQCWAALAHNVRMMLSKLRLLYALIAEDAATCLSLASRHSRSCDVLKSASFIAAS